MIEETGYRIRANVKKSMKGIFTTDVTVEIHNKTSITVIKNKKDLGDVLEKPLATAIWDTVDEVEKEGRARGKAIVKDAEVEEE